MSYSQVDVTIQVPEDIGRSLVAKGQSLVQWVREALAIEGYRSRALTSAQVGRLLGLDSRWEVDAFLKKAQAYLDYDEEDLERDIEAIREASPTEHRGPAAT